MVDRSISRSIRLFEYMMVGQGFFSQGLWGLAISFLSAHFMLPIIMIL